jgi:RNA methyltransferase, TrmH family
MITKSQVKYIQSLGQKKVRDQEQVMVAEGPKIINELLAAPNLEPVSFYALKEWLEIPGVPSLIRQADCTVISSVELERISFLSTPHQVLGIFKKPVFTSNPDYSSGISLMLDDVQDPGNLGTIIRIADWFGIHRIICSNTTADAYSPKVVQSTMGSIARVSLLYTDLEDWMATHPSVELYAATLSGKPLNECKKMENGVIVIGNESGGIRSSILKAATQQVTIPKKGKAESLNAAVATGIILSHICL